MEKAGLWNGFAGGIKRLTVKKRWHRIEHIVNEAKEKYKREERLVKRCFVQIVEKNWKSGLRSARSVEWL